MKEITKNMAFWDTTNEKWKNVTSILTEAKIYKSQEGYYVVYCCGYKEEFDHLTFNDLMEMKKAYE